MHWKWFHNLLIGCDTCLNFEIESSWMSTSSFPGNQTTRQNFSALWVLSQESKSERKRKWVREKGKHILNVHYWAAHSFTGKHSWLLTHIGATSLQCLHGSILPLRWALRWALCRGWQRKVSSCLLTPSMCGFSVVQIHPLSTPPHFWACVPVLWAESLPIRSDHWHQPDLIPRGARDNLR